MALLAVLAPLVAGGGNELFPTEQLAAYPITARTQYLASLVLTPLNLAWTTQLVALVGLTAYVSGPSAQAAAGAAHLPGLRRASSPSPDRRSPGSWWGSGSTSPGAG